MVPGEFRSEAKHEVVVGRHQPPSGHRVGEFMRYFEQRCSVRDSGPANAGVMLAVAHHRFNYIHPFPDGNGRVSRLMSHAMALQAGVGARLVVDLTRTRSRIEGTLGVQGDDELGGYSAARGLGWAG